LAALRASILPALVREILRDSAVAGLRFPALQSRGGDGWPFRGLCSGGLIPPSWFF